MSCIKGFLRKFCRRDPHDNSTIFAFLVQAIGMSQGEPSLVRELVSVDLAVRAVYGTASSRISYAS